jgi:hypothetical protein
MTETITATTIEPDATRSAIFLHPTEILMRLIVALLAPMFLSVSGGDIATARMAAAETVNAYRAQSQADLVAIAQIVAFGFAALGSLSLSMQDNISVTMALRLRGNANACSRSAEQNRRALSQARGDGTAPESIPNEEDVAEAQVIASVAAVQARVAETQARLQAVAPSVVHTPRPAPAPNLTRDQQRQAAWAAAAAHVAAEYTADLPNMPPAERRAATIRAAALSSCAHDLLSDAATPRLRPGDLAAMMRPNAV